ncbi:MAG: hypothetical protein KY469_03385 [Actinobacteria bacterium]|nr:hypothetical protein [Actinomycetota bacterium]
MAMDPHDTAHQSTDPPRSDLHLDDDGFVRAPVPLVYRRITDIAAWEEWWPGLKVEPRSAPGEAERFDLTLRRRTALGSLRLEIRPHSWQHHDRFSFEYRGALVGHGQWWLEAGWGGTVVHHWFVGHSERRQPLKVLAAYRRALRRGLWGFKDHVQSLVRTEAGRPA